MAKKSKIPHIEIEYPHFRSEEELVIFEDELNHNRVILIAELDEVVDKASAVIDKGITIRIGIQGCYEAFLESFLHEVQEAFLMVNKCRYLESLEDEDCMSSTCIFVFSHAMFQQMVLETTGLFLRHFPKMHDVWQIYNKELDSEEGEE
ncbi:MAG TPA: hypothetical protein PLA71_00215 [Saccharofermentans sp.]|nr:hypothetical protein [Saccharofermentans sp.]